MSAKKLYRELVGIPIQTLLIKTMLSPPFKLLSIDIGS